MKIVVIGGGPAGLYFALLAKQRFPDANLAVFEQNPRDATYGFGIVLAERGLDRFRTAHAESYQAIMASSFVTRHRVIAHPGGTLFIEGGGYGAAIARLRLLNILEGFCEREGVAIHYESHCNDDSQFDNADLVVGADGANSVVRHSLQSAFCTTSWNLGNRIAWYGTTRHFPYPILAFKKTALGHFVAAAYPYTEEMSTFVAECDASTWSGSGLGAMDEATRRGVAEQVFAEELEGHPLISNKSEWRTLPVIRNRAWHAGNRVLIGDALHSAHPSIGSGTRIAMEDAIALADALDGRRNHLSEALARFRSLREPHKEKWVSAAEKSFTWYESFAAKMDALDPVEFVYDFMTRTGKVDAERLKTDYPEFMKRYASHCTLSVPRPIRTGAGG